MVHDCIVLSASSATSSSAKDERSSAKDERSSAKDERSPVRIFVGTEDGQWRAERIFVWSVEQVRDPSRVYEIHLMKRLPGFNDKRWLTGFTNYRFVIPHLTGAQGRAIYNDVDQIYLRDPADLFDLDMGDHGYFSINEKDTSVMLIDTEKMAPVWPLERTRRDRRKSIERAAATIPGLWGRLDGGWNSRDTEYEPGSSKLVHFTTIHTQPWMPFPGRFSYQHNPVGELWDDLERSADEAGFQLFSEQRPSLDYQHRLDQLATRSEQAMEAAASAAEVDALETALVAARATTVLEAGLGGGNLSTVAERSGRRIVHYDPSAPPSSKRPSESFDAVVFKAGLESVPDSDLNWSIESLFRFAHDLVYVSIQEDAEHPDGRRAGYVRDRFFWSERFSDVAARHPHVDWQIGGVRGQGSERRICWTLGRPTLPEPLVWVLDDGKTGHLNQSLGLAAALGWTVEMRRLHPNGLQRVGNRLQGSSLIGVNRRRSDGLTPPWPDLVISAGCRSAPVARWVAKQNRGRTRIVQLGRRGGNIVDGLDLAVTCAHFRLFPHRRRLETLVPICGITNDVLTEARQRWPELRGDEPDGPVVVLVGGSSAHHEFDTDTARQLGEEVVGLAGRRRILAITSPRTGEAATDALAAALGEHALLHRWQKGDSENPYRGYLAAAGTLVVTGESESMLGEAVAVGVPVYIYPIPEKRRPLTLRFREWVRARAYARPMKRGKGTVRPQQGTEAFWSRVLAHGFVRTHRDLAQLHRDLIAQGAARPFGEPFESGPGTPLREVDAVATRVREMMGLARPAHVDSGRAQEDV
jgi:mitochondrial fission protein ELM1